VDDMQRVSWAQAAEIALQTLLIQETKRRALDQREAIEVWRPTPVEWADYVAFGLEQLGITHEELTRQARARDFQSLEARYFWLVIGDAPNYRTSSE
jgi:hypothetical protein